MRNALVMLCRIGASVPLVMTELGVFFALVVASVIFLRDHTFSFYGALGFLLGIGIAAGLGYSLARMFSRIWAMIVAASASLLWLGFGIQTWYDVAAHPEKYRYDDSAEAVIFLIPLGAIGVFSWAVLFHNEWVSRHSSDDRSNAG